MANPNQSEKSVALDREENITRGNIAAKKVAVYVYDANTDTLIPGTGGSASSDPNSIQQTDLITALRQLLIALTNPPHIDKTINRVRETAIIESGTITTVSTVTTLSNITNIDSYQARLLMINANNGAWADVVRRAIS